MMHLLTKRLHFFYLLIGTVCLLQTGQIFAEVNLRLSKSSITINETVQMIFTQIGDKSEPDFAPLLRDFEIISQSQQSKFFLINGKTTSQTDWIITAYAKKEGQIIIPEITFGSDISKISTLQVVTEMVLKNQKNTNVIKDLMLEVTVDKKQLFVQEQMLVTVKIYTRKPIMQASLSALELDQAIVQKLGDEAKYQGTKDGVNYQILERRYAVFPQKSGVMKIPVLQLNAQIEKDGSNNFNLFNFRETIQKRTRSKPVIIDVAALPDNFSGNHWLASEQISLQQTWSESIEAFKVGEPITRTLSISALGNTAAQLPAFFIANADFKTYSDDPKLISEPSKTGMSARIEQKIAYIASKAGSYILPAIRIPWFNTVTRQMEVAEISEQRVTVMADATKKPVISTDDTQTTSNNLDKKVMQNSQLQNRWWPYVAFIFALFWLVSMLFVWRLYRKLTKKQDLKINVKSPTKTHKLSKHFDEKQLKTACDNHDAKLAQVALLIWAKEVFDTQDNRVIQINQIAKWVGGTLGFEIESLNRFLYAHVENAEWHGEGLWDAFSAQKMKKNPLDIIAKDKPEVLKSLHKIQ